MSDVRFIYVPLNLGICATSRLRCAFSESQDCVPSASAAGSFCRSWMIFCPFSLDMVLLVWQPFSPIARHKISGKPSMLNNGQHHSTHPDCNMPPMEADTTYQLRRSSILRATHSKFFTVRQTGKV